MPFIGFCAASMKKKKKPTRKQLCLDVCKIFLGSLVVFLDYAFFDIRQHLVHQAFGRCARKKFELVKLNTHFLNWIILFPHLLFSLFFIYLLELANIFLYEICLYERKLWWQLIWILPAATCQLCGVTSKHPGNPRAKLIFHCSVQHNDLLRYKSHYCFAFFSRCCSTTRLSQVPPSKGSPNLWWGFE